MLWFKKLRRERYKLVKGTRHIGPVSSVEGVSIDVFELSDAFVDRSNKDCPTVYQKRSQVLGRKASYTW